MNMNKQETEPASLQETMAMKAKGEIKEEVDQDQDFICSPKGKRKVKVTVVKVKVEHDDNSEDRTFQLKKEEDDEDKDKKSGRSSSDRLEYWRKRRRTRTPEQLRKDAQYHRLYRQRKKESMTPEDRVRESEKRRRRDEERTKGEKNAEKSRQWRQRLREKMTPEEYEAYRRKERERLRNYDKRMPKKLECSGLPPEEIKEMQRQKRREIHRRKMEEMTEEEREELRRKRRENKKNLSKEAKEKQRFYQFYMKQMKFAKMTEEERREWTRRNTESARRWRENLTGEKLEKYKEYNMRRNESEEFKKKCTRDYKRLITTMTPEERRKRLRMYQVNSAAQKLRKELREQGVPPEDIKKQVQDLKKRMWEEPLPPLEAVSAYKPRPRRNQKYQEFYEENESETATGSSSSVPIRKRGRPPGSGSSRRQRKPSSPPENRQIETVQAEDDAIRLDKMHVDFDFDNDHDHSLDSSCFHEDTSSVLATPADTSVRDLDETELIVQFDLSCPHCPSSYSQKTDLLAHISSEHPSQCWKCPLCRSIVLSPGELQEHFKAEHSNTNTPSITERYDTAATASAVTSPPPCELDLLSCVDRTVIASSDNTAVLMETPPKSSASKTFKCIKCIETDTAFECHEDLLEHFKSIHPESHWPCPKCNILKYTERSLSIHSKLCKGSSSSSVPDKPPYSCGLLLDCRKCKSVFKSQKDLRIHVKYTHPQSYWLCLRCNELKYSETSLYRHKNEHCMAINAPKKSVRGKKKIQNAQSVLNSSGKCAKLKKCIS